MQNQKVEPLDVEALIHPDLKEPLSKMKPFPTTKEGLAEARNFNKLSAPKPASQYDDSIQITTKYIPGPKDSPDIFVKIYRNRESETSRPGLLWIHGGGYLAGHPDASDLKCQGFAYEADCIVLNPAYRLAPEDPYPAGLEDCYATLVWMKDSAQELGIDVNRIAVGGGSAGGGLCAALTLLNRDRGGPKLCFQFPLYPMIDNRNVTTSSYQIVETRVWNRENNIQAWEMYLGDHAKGEISPYAAASLATDFSRLPPTFTLIGSLDVFRDETIEYVAKLLQDGVPTEFHTYPGCFHAFDWIVPDAQVSKDATVLILKALKKAFQK